MQYQAVFETPLGEMLARSDGEAVTALCFWDQRFLPAEPAQAASLALFDRLRAWLDAYFAGQRPPADALPLAPAGTPFRRAVWRRLCEIPYGQTTTYGDLAAQLAVDCGVPKMAAQAVGGAVGHNPIALLIPCHRVVGRGDLLGGYGAGLDRKRRLLALEAVDVARLR